MRTHFEYDIDGRDSRLAELEDQTVELERQLSDARLALERQRQKQSAGPYDSAGDRRAAGVAHPHGPLDRTGLLLDRGRSNAYAPGMPLRRKVVLAAAAVAVVAIVAALLAGGGPSWPASVGTVQTEAARACQNPNVAAEPDELNFACGKDTRQILWVFALLTSGDNPGYDDASTGRVGLEPITPQQGGTVAWTLNLHSPYNPASPVDSLEVAARAINNIIGGATVTGTNGKPSVLAGLESNSQNCRRYTGSAALRSRAGFPSLCARPLTSLAGQGALVTDVFQKWMVGATAQQAHDAAVLFENAQDPGAPQVQAILQHLRGARQPTDD